MIGGGRDPAGRIHTVNIPPDRFAPAPGATALQARKICDELAHNINTIARNGVSDWSQVDVAATEFVLALSLWEARPDGLRWVHVLAAFNDVLAAVRETAQRSVLELDGELWKLG